MTSERNPHQDQSLHLRKSKGKEGVWTTEIQKKSQRSASSLFTDAEDRSGGRPPRWWSPRRHRDISLTAASPSIQQVNRFVCSYCCLFIYFWSECIKCYIDIELSNEKSIRLKLVFSHLRNSFLTYSEWLNIILKLTGTICIVKSFIQIQNNHK